MAYKKEEDRSILSKGIYKWQRIKIPAKISLNTRSRINAKVVNRLTCPSHCQGENGRQGKK